MKNRQLNSLPERSRSRRGFLLASGAAAMLAACGGGGGGSGGGAPPSNPPAGFRDRYVPAASRFAASQHTATLAADGSVLLVGGSRGLPTLSDGIDRFDPQAATVRRIGSLPAGRSGHRATRVPSGSVVISGGLVSENDPRRVEVIDERTGLCTAGGVMSVPRVDHAAVALADGRVLMTGGYASGERAALGISDSAEIWDPQLQTTRRLVERMRMARAAHTMTLLADGRVLIVGGYTAAAAYQFAEVFDPATERFAAMGAVGAMRASHAAHAQPDGRVLILGGEATAPGSIEITPLASVVRFDPASGAFAEIAPLASARTWSASVMIPDGRVFLFGGQHAMPRYTASAECYDPSSGGRAIANLDGERALHTATRLQDGRILVAGGEAWGGGYTDTLLMYD
jgi:hypothetical protein